MLYGCHDSFVTVSAVTNLYNGGSGVSPRFTTYNHSNKQKGDGEEFARILLSTILGKPIRKVKVYDVEPNNKYEKESLPRRMRYYHALIDTQILASGVDYNRLQNVIIIIILPYDPFDQNRMVYTIQNQCVEKSTISYDDGAKKIFLYTKGTEGNPSQELKDMLKYIENSTQNNITNPNIESIHRFVEKVRRNKEVGINYMKSWEHDKWMRDKGREEGRNEGQDRINELIIKLSEAGRMEDIIRSAKDRDYQEKLLEELEL